MAPSKPFLVGLTGGIASGKSTVAERFAELGANVIDTDVIAREVVEPGQPALDEIRSVFGDAVIGEDGRLDRRAMRRIVFSDNDARARLERILHPRIRERAMSLAAEGRGEYQLVVVPLLAESPLREAMDRIVVVDCDERDQIRRLVSRDGESEDRARKILAAQATRAERLAIADDVIRNDGTIDAALARVDALHRLYVELARDAGRGRD